MNAILENTNRSNMICCVRSIAKGLITNVSLLKFKKYSSSFIQIYRFYSKVGNTFFDTMESLVVESIVLAII